MVECTVKLNIDFRAPLKGASGMPTAPYSPQHDTRAWGDGQEGRTPQTTRVPHSSGWNGYPCPESLNWLS